MADNYLQKICQALQQSKQGDGSVDLVSAALAELGVGQFLQTATHGGDFLLVNVTGLECDPNNPTKPLQFTASTSALGIPNLEVAFAFAIDETNSVIYSTIAPKVDGQPFTLAHVGGVDMMSYLPSAFTKVGVELVSFGYVYDPGHLESVRVKLVAKTDWPIVNGIVTLAQASIDVTVPLQYPTYTSGTVGGVVTLFDGSLELSASYPSWAVDGKLVKPVSINKIFDTLFGIEIPSGVSAGQITVLDFSARPQEKSYGADFALADNQWRLPVLPTGTGLALTSISFHLKAVNGEVTEASAAAKIELGHTKPFIPLELSAKRVAGEGTTYGWELKGGLQQGKKIPLLDILGQFLPADWNIVGNLPDSLAGLDLTELDATFNTLDESFKFAAALTWDLSQVLPGNPTITAGLELASPASTNGDDATPAIGPASAPTDNLPAIRDTTESRTYTGKVYGSLTVGSLELGVIYAFEKDNATITFGLKFHQLEFHAAYNETTKTVTVSLGDLSLGTILTWLVNLVDPSRSFTLEAPWSFLNDLNLKDLAITVNLEDRSVGVVYTPPKGTWNFAIVEIDQLGLVYSKKSQSGTWSVDIKVGGTFLGAPRDFNKNPLTWDVLNEKPPEVPGQGSQLLDLQYLGLGQRIRLQHFEELQTIEDVINALMSVADPSETPQLGLPAGVEFNAQSQWLIGTQLTVMGTVTVSAVFNDPVLYGLRIALGGEKAKSFAGLSFEILYRKITDTIGLYHLSLTLPDSMRHLEFGEVSITLPVLVLDIYTNGNFRVDAGFPKGLDFTNSFSVQVFPFVGYGGFYFAVLNGATSKRVPAIPATVGAFSPVIEFGIGLSIGVGKSIEAGPLKAGVTVTAIGILEGVIGWFNPVNTSTGSATYVSVQGTVAIVGQLYGEVDFVIISGKIEVTAYASITVTIESYRPILLALDVGVSVNVSLKIIVFTIHFSFSTRLHVDWTIGEATTPPWGAVGPSTAAVQQRAFERGQLRAQRMVGRSRALSMARPALHLLAAPPLDWTPPTFGGQVRTIEVTLLPAFTVAASQSVLGPSGITAAPPPGMTGPQYEAVVQLVIENSIDPGAYSAADVVQVGPLHTASTMPFNLFAEGVFYWVVNTVADGIDGDVTATELAIGATALGTPTMANEAFSSERIDAFLSNNYRLDVVGPTGSVSDLLAASADQARSGTPFPMIPHLSFDKPDGTHVDFSERMPVDPEYSAKVKAYFSQLAQDPLADVADHPSGPTGLAGSRQTMVATGPTASLAAQTFQDYFALVAKTAVQNAQHLLDNFPYLVPDHVATRSAVARPRPAGPAGLADLAAGTGLLGAATGGTGPSLGYLESAFGATAELILAANANRPILTQGTRVPLDGVLYQIKDGDTLAGIARTFAPNGATMSPASIAARSATATVLRHGSPMWIGGIEFPVASGDDVELVAAILQTRSSGVPQVSQLALMKQGLVCANPGVFVGPAAFGVGPKGITAGLTLLIPQLGPTGATAGPTGPTGPSGTSAATGATGPCAANQIIAQTYVTRESDTLDLVAGYFLRKQLGLVDPVLVTAIANNYPSGITAGQTLGNLPSLGHLIGSDESFQSIASRMFSDPRSLADAAATSPPIGVSGPTGPNSSNTTLLAPRGVVNIPKFTYTVGPTGTIGWIANTYNLTLDELAKTLRPINGLFATGATVGIPNAQQAPVALLSQTMMSTGTYHNIAASVARFMLHGTRLPSPLDPEFQALTIDELANGDAIVDLWGNADLNGSQFGVTGDSIDLTFTKPAGIPWLHFDGATGPTGGGGPTGATGATIDPNTLRLHLTDISRALPSLDFTPGATAGLLPYVHNVPTRYPLEHVVHWQSAAPPTIGPSGPGPLAGEPTIWMFSNSFQSNLGETAEYFELCQRTTDQRSTSGPSPVDRFEWATMVEFKVQQVVAAGGPMPNTYLILGTDQAGRDAIEQAWVTLHKTGQLAELYLLYPPNASSANPAGLASDKLDRDRSFLLQTNLSTLTHSGPTFSLLAQGLPTTGEHHATLAPSASPDFLKLLWEASIVGTGGYYLNYVSASGNGIPGTVFDQQGEATIFLVMLVQTQLDVVYPFNNCAIVGDNIDASTTSVFSQSVTGPHSSTHLTPTPAFPPGQIGFRVSRPDPGPTALGPTWETQALYNLLSYQVTSPTGPTGATALISRQAPPSGPLDHDENATGGLPLPEALASAPKRWDWRQTVPLAKIVANTTLPTSAALPDPGRSPYSGIVERLVLGVDVDFQDLYGNRTVASPPNLSVSVPLGYYDEIIPLAQWPGVGAHYGVTGPTGNPDPELVVDVGLDLSDLVPGFGRSVAEAGRQAAAKAVKYRQIYYQVQQPDYDFTVQTSLDTATASVPLSIAKPPLADLVTSAYVFATTAAGFLGTTVTVPAAATTLGELATTLSMTAGQLLAANGERATNAVLAGTVQIPNYQVVAHGDSLNSIAGEGGNPITLGTQNLQAPLAGMAVLATKPSTATLPAGTPGQNRSFQQIANFANCTVAGLAAANADASIIAKAVTFVVRGKPYRTDPENSASLNDVAQAFGDAPFYFSQVNAAEIATSNAEVLAIDSTVTSVNVSDYVVHAGDTFASLGDTPETPTLIEQNVATTSIYVSGTPLFLKCKTAQPDTTDLATFLTDHQITAAQFGSFNGSSALVPGAELDVPELATLPTDGYAAYSAPAGLQLADLATSLGASPGDVAGLNADVPGLFDPNQNVTACGVTKSPIGADATFTSLFEHSRSNGGCATLELFAAAIADTPGLFVPGAVILVPLPTTASATTLSAAAEAANVDVGDLARANAATYGFLNPGQVVSLPDGDTKPLTIGSYETFNTLVGRFRDQCGITVTIDDIASANAAPALLVAAGARFVIPPRPANVSAGFTPKYPDLIFEVTVDLGQHRDDANVAAGARSNPRVASVTGRVAPFTTGSDQTTTHALTEFAAAFEQALRGLKAATGQIEGQNNVGGEPAREVWAIDFGDDGLHVVPGPGYTKFFGIQPLSNHLMTRQNVPIDAYGAGR